METTATQMFQHGTKYIKIKINYILLALDRVLTLFVNDK